MNDWRQPTDRPRSVGRKGPPVAGEARHRVRILAGELDPIDQGELLERFDHGTVMFHNVDTLGKLQRSPDFARYCSSADFCVADGRIVTLAARFLGSPVPAKISGSDFMPAFCAYHQDDPDVTVFLLGSAPGVAERARRHLNAPLRREVVVGAHSPSYAFDRDPDETAAIVDLVNASGATVLAVGVGAPKQELWIAANRDRLTGVRAFLPVGATFDFQAGVVRRAPAWMSESGLEWLWRLAREPRRLWRRYLWEGPRVLALVLRQRVGLYRVPFEVTSQVRTG